MSGKLFRYEEVSYRLMHYKSTVYKFKIEFVGCWKGKNPTRKVLTPSESDQVNRTIGVLVHQKYRRRELTNALQTMDFLIRCSERPWKIGRKVGFRLRGKELAVHDSMFALSVEPKQKKVTVANGCVALRERPHTGPTDSEGERGGATQTRATEQQWSSTQQGPKSRALEQETFTDQFRKAAQASEPLPRLLRSSSKPPCEMSPGQMQRSSGPSPKSLRKSQKLSRKEKSPKQVQGSQEVSPRQLRKIPRLLLSEKFPAQLQKSSAVSPRKICTKAKSSQEQKSPRKVKRNLEVSPSTNPKSPTTRFSRNGLTKSPEKRGMTEVSPRILRRSPRFSPATSNQSTPVKSPERHGVLDRFSPNPSKRTPRSHSVGSEDDTVAKQFLSNSAKLLKSDVASTEKLLRTLDKEFVRREFEQEELRLRNLAKPSTSSAEREAWLSSL